VSRVVAVTMVRDEADIIEHTVRNMASQVDAVIVADNMSKDQTRPILERLVDELPIPLVIVDDLEVGYNQSDKMTALALRARLELGADWVIPFDADEIWMPMDPERTIKDVLLHTHPSWQTVEALLFDYVATAVDPADEPDPVKRLGWRRRRSAPLPKVACRWAPGLYIEMGNHGATFNGLPAVQAEQNLRIVHFPYRSAEQVIQKIRNGAEAYAATDLDEKFGAHWRGWGRILDSEGEGAIADLFRKWHFREDPNSFHTIDGETQPPLILDPVV